MARKLKRKRKFPQRQSENFFILSQYAATGRLWLQRAYGKAEGDNKCIDEARKVLTGLEECLRGIHDRSLGS